MAESHGDGFLYRSYNAAATYLAGNTGSAAVSFEVTVTHDSLAVLTRRFVTDAAVASGLIDKLEAAKTQKPKKGDNGPLGAYINQVRAQRGKAVTAPQADILIRLAELLQQQTQ